MLDGDDCGNARKGLEQGFFQGDPQRRSLGRAGRARALERDPDGTVSFDPDQLYVAPVGDQPGSEAIEHLLYFFVCDVPGLEFHGDWIDQSSARVEAFRAERYVMGP